MIWQRRRDGFRFWILKYLDASRPLWTFCQHHAVSSALPLPLQSYYKFRPLAWCQKRPFHVLRYIIIYIFAHLHRNSIQLSIPYPRPISLESNVKGAFDVNHHSDNWPNCNGHYWNCNYPLPWCGNQTVSITSFLLFVLFSKTLPWKNRSKLSIRFISDKNNFQTEASPPDLRGSRGVDSRTVRYWGLREF